MNKKLKIFIFLILLFNIFSIGFYLNFESKIDSNKKLYDNSINKLKNIIFDLYSYDLKLYTSQNLVSFENKKQKDLEDIINIKNENPLFSKKIDTAISNYNDLVQIKIRINEINRLHNISSIKDFDKKLISLIEDYERTLIITINSLREVLDDIENMNYVFNEKIKNSLLFYFLTLSILNLFSILFFLKDEKVKFKKIKEKFIQKEINLIIEFIREENLNNSYPTIKDLKKELKVTHPTILKNIKILEDKNIIEIKKKGRNKYLKLV